MKASNAISSRTDKADAPTKSAESSSSTVERFRLSGPSADLDPRIHAFRGDLADVALASLMFAPHYAAPVERNALKPATLRLAPQDDAEEVAELAAGDVFAMLDLSGGWAWGFRPSDHLVGYIPATALESA